MSWLREPNAEPIAGYRLIAPLGTGGFGEVWKCEAPGGIFKAIKFVYGNLNSLDGDAVRAEQEKKALERIKEVRYPFVLSMDRIDEVGGELVIVMELADKSLHDCLQEAQANGMVGIPREELLCYLRDAAEGLDFLNDHFKLQHLDVKPRNLFVIADRVKVADFGLVKGLERSSSSGLMGGVSPLYAAPETFSGKLSRNTDQYSLAIVYMELLTGQRPFNGKNIRQLAIQHMTEEPDLRALPERDRPVVARALAKDPAKRYPNCTAFVRALAANTPGRSEGSIDLDDFAPQRPTTRTSFPELQLDPSTLVRQRQAEVALLQGGPPAAAGEDSQLLGATAANVEVGVLRPTLFVGLGNFGRRALLELRCRLLDRVGDLAQVPLFRFLYLDADAEAAEKAVCGPADLALAHDQVFPIPLQPVGNYRRRILDHVSEWLPREKLYSIPRSLQPQGSRALGRLAFSDNYLRFITRVRREVQVATHPESLAQSLSQTGLSLRDNCPRVYVFAGATGGSAGALVDLGFAVRRLLTQMHFQAAQINALLFCGAPGDPATPKQELANLYATLTELNHFNDPAISFTAQYGGPDGPKLVAQGLPYNSLYLLQLEHRTPEAMRDCVAHMAGYLAQDLTTALGFELEQEREAPPDPDRTPFRSFGTFGVWLPRGLLLRAAARQTCLRLIDEWQSGSEPNDPYEIASNTDQALSDPGLAPELLGAQIERAAHTGEGSPAQAMAVVLAGLEGEMHEAATRTDPGGWARQAFERVRDWAGLRHNPEADGVYQRRSRLTRVMNQASAQVAEEWEQRLCGTAMAQMDRPGRRLSAAEMALQRMIQFCDAAAQIHAKRSYELAVRSEEARADLQASLDACYGGSGFSLFGSRTARTLRHFYELLVAFARHRLAEELAEANVNFFRRLHAGLEERLRDLSFCRQRLAHLQRILESPPDAYAAAGPGAFGERSPSPSPVGTGNPFQDAVRESRTLQVVLPDGEWEIERAAERFLLDMQPRQWERLEHVLQSLVLAPLGGLYPICQKTNDLMRQLASPLIEQTAAFLSDHLPETDVAEVEFSAAQAQGVDVADQVKGFFVAAAPMVAGPEDEQKTYFLVPDSPSGHALGDESKKSIPGVKVVRVSGQATDLLVCREQGFLRATDLREALQGCREAYDELAAAPPSSPHARFDILEWMPLDV